MTTTHRVVNPGELAPPVGFSHAVVATSGRTIYLGGQAAHDRAGRIVGRTIVEQFDKAAENVVAVLRACDAEPSHLVSMTIYATDTAAYRRALPDLGVAYRKHFGDHYPAIALAGVQDLFDADALVELVCVAVVP